MQVYGARDCVKTGRASKPAAVAGVKAPVKPGVVQRLRAWATVKRVVVPLTWLVTLSTRFWTCRLLVPEHAAVATVAVL